MNSTPSSNNRHSIRRSVNTKLVVVEGAGDRTRRPRRPNIPYMPPPPKDADSKEQEKADDSPSAS